jgi:hypothetical protein
VTDRHVGSLEAAEALDHVASPLATSVVALDEQALVAAVVEHGHEAGVGQGDPHQRGVLPSGTTYATVWTAGEWSLASTRPSARLQRRAPRISASGMARTESTSRVMLKTMTPPAG